MKYTPLLFASAASLYFMPKTTCMKSECDSPGKYSHFYRLPHSGNLHPVSKMNTYLNQNMTNICHHFGKDTLNVCKRLEGKYTEVGGRN